MIDKALDLGMRASTRLQNALKRRYGNDVAAEWAAKL